MSNAMFALRQIVMCLAGLLVSSDRLWVAEGHPFLAIMNPECVLAPYSSGVFEFGFSGIRARNGCEGHICPKNDDS